MHGEANSSSASTADVPANSDFCAAPRSHPNVALLVRCEDHRHRLRLDWLHDHVGLRGKEAVHLMRSRYRLGFGAAITVEGGPCPGEGGQGPILIQREPHHVLFFAWGFGAGARQD